MEFEIAKKLTKPAKGQKGLSLRSITANADGCQMILVDDAGYKDMKAAVEGYRMLKGAGINYRARGSSLEITTDSIDMLLDFSAGMKFNTEDALDCMEFLRGSLPIDGADFVSLNLDQSRMALVMNAEDPDAVQAAIMPVLDKYDMGIVR